MSHEETGQPAKRPAPVIRVGCAGWSIPQEHAARFADAGSHLERYAGRFPAVEINSSFYRPHRPATYSRWAASVPEGFQFAVKVPREITHTRRLTNSGELVERFLSECQMLGASLGPLLVQLPPSLAFDRAVVPAFFERLRESFTGRIACEPRHPTWFSADAEQVLTRFQIARVAADPAVVPAAAQPGGWDGLIYYRLHGSPRVYYSAYAPSCLETLAETLGAASRSAPTWCIFDNTALGAATDDALAVIARLAQP